MNVVLYVHGKGGSAAEAEHYKPLFPSCDVVGLDYKSDTPWEIKTEIKETAKSLKARYGRVILIANSIGAFFCMNADIDELIFNAYFISPIVDMEKLILDMMLRANITELELQEKGIIQTDSEELSWKYLSYVREHPIKWSVPTEILYGDKDHLTAYETITDFSRKHNAHLTVMENGEHWFHTKEQMRFLDDWMGCQS
ncbi:MAG: alpha/beta hydrolase [Clostridia bacterium]|nr:alpha/beta hydrolase [Clostridia bacterium]